jgi:hypothetical protein
MSHVADDNWLNSEAVNAKAFATELRLCTTGNSDQIARSVRARTSLQ